MRFTRRGMGQEMRHEIQTCFISSRSSLGIFLLWICSGPITVIELVDHLEEARLKAWGSKESQYGRKKNERILNQFSRFISC